MNVIVTAAAVVTALSGIGSGALYLDHLHASAADFEKHLSEQRVRTIFSYMDQIGQQGPQPWLCRALDEEFIALCTELPNHALCADRKEIMEEVGC